MIILANYQTVARPKRIISFEITGSKPEAVKLHPQHESWRTIRIRHQSAIVRVPTERAYTCLFPPWDSDRINPPLIFDASRNATRGAELITGPGEGEELRCELSGPAARLSRDRRLLQKREKGKRTGLTAARDNYYSTPGRQL